jgi:ubiquinone/menaquinone biosynthesis C-methylase UbiE
MPRSREIRTDEKKFWNDPNNIKWFKTEPAPEYWRKFFQETKGESVQRVLDLGCGAGRNTELLYTLGYDVFACDLHQGMIQTTIERLKDAGMDPKEVGSRVLRASMLALPYRDEVFEAIVSNGVYHNAFNIKELNQALKESARVLKPKGYLCFNLFSSKTLSPDFRDLGKNVYLTKENLLMVLVSKNQFLSMAQEHGLQPEEEIVEYEREVSTGKRAVMRGILRKTK